MPMTFPADFEKCVREGGRVKTTNPKEGTYIHVCWDKQGKSHSGEVKHSKKEASEEALFLQNQGYIENDGEFIKSSETMLRKLVPQISLSEVFSASKPTSEIEILHAGEWEHPQYGVIKITDEDIDKFLDSFNEKVRKVDIAVDQEHMPEKGAAGWFRSMKKVFEDGKTKLKATVEWTKLGTQLIKDGIFKYFSPEFDFAYEDMETHEQFENVLLGGALTNRPYFKSLAPVALSENMYAGFTSKTKKGGENRMTKEELKAKLAEDSAFVLANDASEEEKKAYEEAKAEIAKDAEDKEEADKKAQEEEEAKKKAEEERIAQEEKDKEVKASEKFISKADHVKELNEVKSKMGVLEAKLQFKEVSEQVEGYCFSESNPSGVLLPKNKKAAIDLLMAATPKVASMFDEFVKGLPAVSAKLFKEEGGEGANKTKNEQIEIETSKVMKDKGLTYAEAVKIVSREKPELFKK